MPTVPKTQDPFGNYTQGKDQSRLAPGNVVPMFRPTETDMAIAMATMHEHGRLFTPNLKSIVEDRRQFEVDRPVKGGPPDNDKSGPGTDSKMSDILFNPGPMASQ